MWGGSLTLVGDWLRLVWINPSGEVTELARIFVWFFDLKKTPSFVLRHYHRNVSGSFVVRLKRTCEFHPRAPGMLIVLHLSALYQLSPADSSGGVKHQPGHHGPKILVHKAYSRNERNRPVYHRHHHVEWFVSPICCKQLSSQSVDQKSDLAREQRGIWHPSLEHGWPHWWICPKRSKFLVQTCSKKNSTNIYKREVYQGLSR